MKRPGIMLFLLFAPVCRAETGPYLGFGLTYGGDRLATISFVDESSEDILAGSGYTMAVGLIRHFEGTPLSIQGSVGYFVDETSATNSHARFSRYPMEILAMFRSGGHRVGGGIVHHLSPTLDLDNLGGRFDFDPATGLVMEYGYHYLSVRYTHLTYTVDGLDVDGSGLGIFATWGY